MYKLQKFFFLLRKIKRIIDSDSDASDSDAGGKGRKTGGASPTAEALFGDVDISSGDDDDDEGEKPTQKLPEKAASDADRNSPDRRGDYDMDQDDEFGGRDKDKEPEEPVPETKIEHEIPYIRADVGKEFHFVKLPNFLSVEPRPYDPETYEDELEEEETLDEEGRARLKLKVENTIRWRTAFDKDGNAFKESNARMVKWSDGSLSLHLGSEIFDVYRQPLQVNLNYIIAWKHPFNNCFLGFFREITITCLFVKVQVFRDKPSFVQNLRSDLTPLTHLPIEK